MLVGWLVEIGWVDSRWDRTRLTARAAVVCVVRVLCSSLAASLDHSASFSLVLSYFWRLVTAR
jgi:hypothetical protein